MKKIVIILDALRNTEIPKFDNGLSGENFSKQIIQPSLSFEPDAAYLTGQSPEKTESGMHFWYDPENSVFKGCKKLTEFLPEYPLFLKRVSKKILLKLNKHTPQKTIGLTPFKFLPYFNFSEKKNLYDKNVQHKYITIFNILKNRGLKYYYIGVPLSSGKLNYIIRNFKLEELLENDIIFVYISDLDSTGHKYGGNSVQYKNKLDEVLKYINEINALLLSKSIDFKYLIFGDHGMTDVERFFNIKKILKNLPVKIYNDYIYFLDSTLARFWFFSEKAKKVIIEAIPDCDYGSWITEEEKQHYRINYAHNKFGDEIWWASGGTLILPNFWQGRRPVKGMHGYRDQVLDNNTMITGNFELPGSGGYITMMDVHSILINFLDLK